MWHEQTRPPPQRGIIIVGLVKNRLVTVALRAVKRLRPKQPGETWLRPRSLFFDEQKPDSIPDTWVLRAHQKLSRGFPAHAPQCR
jgi:hypothetical protein